MYFYGKPRPNYLVSSSLNQIKLCSLSGVPGRNSALNSTADCCFFQAAHGNSHILLSHTQDQLLEFTKNFPQYFFPCLAITLCHGNGISQQAVAEFSHAAATTAGHKHSHKHSQRSQHLHSFQIRFLNILTN